VQVREKPREGVDDEVIGKFHVADAAVPRMIS